MTDPTDGVLLDAPGDSAHVIADLAARTHAPVHILEGHRQGLLVPAGYQVVETEYPERLLDSPRRIVGTARFVEHDSFIAYVNRQRTDRTTLWGDWEKMRIEAVINDDHEAGNHPGCEAGWRDQRAVLQLRPTPEWEAWHSIDGKALGQAEFAEFLEDHLDEVDSPPAAELLDIVRTFTANSKMTFRSAVRLQDGTRQLTYSEEMEAAAGAGGQLEVPEQFRLVIVPFDGAEPYRVTVRLRYRIREGGLRIGIALLRSDRVLRDAFDHISDLVHAATETDIYAGQAPAARST